MHTIEMSLKKEKEQKNKRVKTSRELKQLVVVVCLALGAPFAWKLPLIGEIHTLVCCNDVYVQFTTALVLAGLFVMRTF